MNIFFGNGGRRAIVGEIRQALQDDTGAPPYGSMCLSSIIKEESIAVFGPAMLIVPTVWLERGKAAVISVEPLADVPSTRWIQIGSSAGIMQSTDIRAAAIVLTGNARKVGDYNAYFRDIHTHSGQVMD